MATEIQRDLDEANEIIAGTLALEPLIKASIGAMDSERHLPAPVVRAVKDLGVFRMAVPRAYGGPELDPMTQVRVVEELSRMDGSVGWCAMIAAAASYASAFFEPATAERLFGPVDASVAGQIMPIGKAEVVEGGYRVNGRFRFASGCNHATMMIGGCLVYEGGEQRRLAGGRPEMRVMIFPPSSCTIVDSWHTTGLLGTGSNDYVVEDLFVPSEESWNPFQRPRIPGPLYVFPQLFLVPHAGVPIGMARGAIDTVMELSGRKESMPSPNRIGPPRHLRDDGETQEAVARAEATLGAARCFAYGTVEELWAVLSRGERPTERQRSIYRIMLVYVHRAAREVISLMYDTAATSAIYKPNPLDRHMRDIVTACQHRVVHPKMYRYAGRLLLGLEPGDPFF